jgi:hypothetical protein
VLNEVADRIRTEGSIGKADIGALLFWKRLRADTPWVSELMTWPEEKVREVTNGAVTAVNEGSLSVPDAASAGRGALSPLPGFDTGDAFASALLLAAAPGHGGIRPTCPSQLRGFGSYSLPGARQVRTLHGISRRTAAVGTAERTCLVRVNATDYRDPGWCGHSEALSSVVSRFASETRP